MYRRRRMPKPLKLGRMRCGGRESDRLHEPFKVIGMTYTRKSFGLSGQIKELERMTIRRQWLLLRRP
jgi:hypothetical protein